ncbi:MAG: hypothetical protein V1729_03845 [Candidatus Woesearchaeota archaeon]
MTQEKQEDPARQVYDSGVKAAARLDKEYGRKANVIQKAYEAAVDELGYSDKELSDKSKAKKIAKLMFSDKYLGNAGFNPLLKESSLYQDFEKKDDIEKGRLYEHMLGMNVDTLVRGTIEQYGGLKRSGLVAAVDRHYNNKAAQQLMALAWQKAYDPDKSLEQNMKSYVDALSQDPIISGSGAKINPGKFESIDDAAHALTTAFRGQSTRDSYQYDHGVDFN